MGSIGQFDCQYPLVCDIHVRLINTLYLGRLIGRNIYTLLGLDIPYICPVLGIYVQEGCGYRPAGALEALDGETDAACRFQEKAMSYGYMSLKTPLVPCRIEEMAMSHVTIVLAPCHCR